MFYPCSENIGADQLRGYREADLRLCFRICKNPVFSRCGSYDTCTMIENEINMYVESASSNFPITDSRLKSIYDATQNDEEMQHAGNFFDEKVKRPEKYDEKVFHCMKCTFSCQ